MSLVVMFSKPPTDWLRSTCRHELTLSNYQKGKNKEKRDANEIKARKMPTLKAI